MKKSPFIVALVLVLVASLNANFGSSAAEVGPVPVSVPVPVSIMDGTIEMPTYDQSGRELQPPLFADSAVTGLYPFTTYTMPLKAGPKSQNYKAIFVENEYLKLTYVPELGGRFLALYDKLRKREVFYRNDVLKPTQMNPRGDWPQEGIELTGPYDVHSLTMHGEPYWSNTVLRKADGSATLLLGEIDPIYGMKVTLSATLHPGVAALEIGVFCFNPNTSRMPQMFWTNASFPATPETRFIYPMSRTVGHNTGQVTDWPMYEGVDYSWDRNNKNMLGVFGIDLYDNFGGAYMFDQDYGVFRFADRRVVQGMKMWTFGHGRDALAMENAYTDKAGPYFEAQSGRHVWDGHYEWVSPHQVEQWSEWWIPVAGTKGLVTLTRDVALNLRVDGKTNALNIDLSAARALADAKLTVSSSHGELLAETVSLHPGATEHRSIKSAASPDQLHDVEVVLTDAMGATLLDYKRPNAGEQRSEYTPFTRELEKPVKSTAAMSAEELVLAAEFRLKELDDKGAMDLLTSSLSKDPGYSVAHTLKGIILYKQGKLHEAEAELQQAVARDPYADRAWYYLAVTQLGLGETQMAERNFYYIWPQSAYYGNREYQLGRIAFLRHDYAQAAAHLAGAINANGQDLSAHQLLAMTARANGNSAVAGGEIDKLLSIDPGSRGAYAERFFLTQDATALTELKRLMGDQTQEALHVAEDYSSLNQWTEAVAILRTVADRNSDPWGTSATFYYTLAYDLQKAGELPEAAVARKQARASETIVDRFPYLASSEAPLMAAAAADPSDYLARFNLGCLLYSLGRKEEAIAQWASAVTINPQYFSAQRALGLAYAERGDTRRAVAELEKANAIDSLHLGTVNDLVTMYARAGRFNDELTLLQTALKQATDKDDLMLRLLHVDLVQGHYKEADEIVEKHTFSPRHRDYELRDEYRALRYAEGSRAFAAGDYKQALTLFHAAQDPPATLGVDDFQFQSTPRLHYYLGRTLDALGQKDEARKAYEQSVKEVDLTAGDHASFNSDNFFMILSLDRLDRKEEADALARRFKAFADSQLSLSRIHRRSEGQYLLALLALQQGHEEEATRFMQQSVRTEPDFLAPRFDLRGDSIGTNTTNKKTTKAMADRGGR